ncbi:MAG: DUF4112 domain-containing protein [Steroidobacteraceae bacterium]|nr:DUF4112 domain-containing protein [Steroidobacteraceae bacterium]
MNPRSPYSPPPATAPEGLRRYAVLAYLFDQIFRVPGTSWRFGLDAIIGLVPGAGDIITGVIGTYGVIIARQLGAPLSVQARMLLNLTIDTVIGAIPLLGDLFDFAFKAHVRNRELLERWLATPHRTQRTSALLLVAFILAMTVLVVGAVWLAVIIVRALIQLLT